VALILRNSPLGGERERAIFAFVTLVCHNHTAFGALYDNWFQRTDGSHLTLGFHQLGLLPKCARAIIKAVT
jgi:hypothetical protein